MATKLLYVRVNPQHWVLVAGDAMVQSYEPEKMWRPVRGALLSSCLAKQRCLDMKPGCHISVRHLGEKRDWSQAALPTNEAQTTVPCDPPQYPHNLQLERTAHCHQTTESASRRARQRRPLPRRDRLHSSRAALRHRQPRTAREAAQKVKIQEWPSNEFSAFAQRPGARRLGRKNTPALRTPAVVAGRAVMTAKFSAACLGRLSWKPSP